MSIYNTTQAEAGAVVSEVPPPDPPKACLSNGTRPSALLLTRLALCVTVKSGAP